MVVWQIPTFIKFAFYKTNSYAISWESSTKYRHFLVYFVIWYKQVLKDRDQTPLAIYNVFYVYHIIISDDKGYY